MIGEGSGGIIGAVGGSSSPKIIVEIESGALVARLRAFLGGMLEVRLLVKD